jgi:hypothetical protein
VYRRALLLLLPLLATACGGSPQVTAESTHQGKALAFARCMRAHGVPSFPDPDAQGSFPSFDTGVSKQVSVAADETCKHLLPSGGAGGRQGGQKLAFALKVAGCLRTHGFPAFPDPTASGQSTPSSIDMSSSQFQAAETACEQRARRALHLP